MKKQILSILLIVGILFTVTACSNNKSNKDEKTLKVGVCAGPYADLFKEAIQPQLENDGYKIEYVEFSDYVQPNNALANEEIDLNVFQHSTYLKNFSQQHNLDLTYISEIPTASMGIFSSKNKSIDEVPQGATVAIPNDETNLSRSLRVLAQTKLITLDKNVDPSKTTVKDIAENPKNLQFKEVSAEILPTVLDSLDLAVINGNYAIGAGLNLADAIYNEKLAEGYFNVIAVRKEDEQSEFASKIKEIVDSESFKRVINDTNNQYISFSKPSNF